ncbi:MAG: SMP-30/gluconolactonase/LRE family protein [Gammaproteobacteria bacterium]|nr:SMP-30/gluconolactonase/LRE family protein [Gammaproteobacteria bacterium]
MLIKSTSRRAVLRGTGASVVAMIAARATLAAHATVRSRLDRSQVTIIVDGIRGPEGPTPLADGRVAMVEFLAGTVIAVGSDGHREMLATPGRGAAGTVLGHDGALYVAKLNPDTFARRMALDANRQPPAAPTVDEPSPSAIVRIDLATGAASTLYDRYDGAELPGPNDLVVDDFGDLWFSDPTSAAVFSARTDGGAINRVIDDVPGVNGITLSPDRRRLYLVSGGALLAYDIAARGELVQRNGHARATVVTAWPAGLHGPDGIKTDTEGNVVCACWEDGIAVFSPEGEWLSQTVVADLRVINIAFGGADRKTLYLAANPAEGMVGMLASIPWADAGMPAVGIGYSVLATGLGFPEAPLVMPDGRVAAVEILNDRITAVTVDGHASTLLEIGIGPNGQAIGPDGSLFVLTNGGRPGQSTGGTVQRIDLASGASSTLYTRYQGSMLNGPNDLVFDEWGDLWFTDFSGNAVYNARSDGSELRFIADLTGANGIGLSPDGRTLFVAQTFDQRVVTMSITGRGQVAQDGHGARVQLLAQLDVSLDSLKVEAGGNIVVASGEAGLTTLAPDGAIVSQSSIGGLRVTNLAFGGPDMRTVYVTANHPGGSRGQLVSLRWPRPGLRLRYT